MTFDQETHPRLEFKENPLKVVATQIRFPEAYGLTEQASLAALQAALKEDYPKALPRTPEVTVSVGGSGSQQTHGGLSPVRFASEEEDWIATVTTSWIGLETTSYKSWAEFQGRLSQLLAALPSSSAPTRATRIGLRFVDEIQGPGISEPSDWLAYIDVSLIGSRDGLILDERLVRGLQVLSFAIADDRVNLRHGYVRGELGEDPPSKYLIDTDLFTEVEQPFDHDAIIGLAERYHHWAWNLFRRSITQATVDLLGGAES